MHIRNITEISGYYYRVEHHTGSCHAPSWQYFYARDFYYFTLKDQDVLNYVLNTGVSGKFIGLEYAMVHGLDVMHPVQATVRDQNNIACIVLHNSLELPVITP